MSCFEPENNSFVPFESAVEIQISLPANGINVSSIFQPILLWFLAEVHSLLSLSVIM